MGPPSSGVISCHAKEQVSRKVVQNHSDNIPKAAESVLSARCHIANTVMLHSVLTNTIQIGTLAGEMGILPGRWDSRY